MQVLRYLIRCPGCRVRLRESVFQTDRVPLVKAELGGRADTLRF